MRKMGLQAIAPGPNLSTRIHQQAIYPYFLRDVTATHPNHIWGIEHHLYSLAAQLALSGRRTGLVRPLCGELVARSDLGPTICDLDVQHALAQTTPEI